MNRSVRPYFRLGFLKGPGLWHTQWAPASSLLSLQAMCIGYSHTRRAVQSLGYTQVPALIEWHSPALGDMRTEINVDVVLREQLSRRSFMFSPGIQTFKALPCVAQVPGLGSFTL